MKSNVKMLLGAVLAALVMMGSGASASDSTDFSGYTGCDRALDGLHQAWGEQNTANPEGDPDAYRKWNVAQKYASACLDVALAICGSDNGFSRPPAKQSSIRACQDLLNGGFDRAVALTTQTFRSSAVGQFHMIEATINVGFVDAEDAVVKFVSDCTSRSPVDCKSINTGGEDKEIHIVNGWGSASDAVSCPSSTRDFADGSMSLGDLMRNIPTHRQRHLDETKLNCTFFSAQPFTVKVAPAGAGDVEPVIPKHTPPPMGIPGENDDHGLKN